MLDAATAGCLMPSLAHGNFPDRTSPSTPSRWLDTDTPIATIGGPTCKREHLSPAHSTSCSPSTSSSTCPNRPPVWNQSPRCANPDRSLPCTCQLWTTNSARGSTNAPTPAIPRISIDPRAATCARCSKTTDSAQHGRATSRIDCHASPVIFACIRRTWLCSARTRGDESACKPDTAASKTVSGYGLILVTL